MRYKNLSTWSGGDVLNRPKELSKAHWKYLERILKVHLIEPKEIEIAKEHYISTFIHGYKHGQEDLGTKGDMPNPNFVPYSAHRQV